MLLRDGAAGLEVLMLERHRDAFFSRALVFPGGRVDPADGDPALIDCCRPVPGASEAEMAFRIAAIRESYEETGLLLARPRDADALIDGHSLRALEATLGGRERPGFAELIASGAVELATDRLVRFAHWVTPERSPKRYDTVFFLAQAPEGQQPRPDGREAVEVAWVTPAAALADGDAGLRRLIFATRLNLLRLQASRAAAAALAAAAAPGHIIARICPELYDGPDGPHLRIPEGLGYDIYDLASPDHRHE